ncbi:MAG TPA: hypothetical protein DCP75_05555 [Haliea salexigens]|uniref:Sulfotransferase family protein n=1 Tax=Haliea salexigens TaxID=287487 RepID=A0A3C1KLS5_9GAMM|nr:hypothetical protein [Haliea sp.]HAN27176.1 hypothetical protein [Haliea salexigens]|tara:strand:- start:9601 stop:10326 length:726 start_codon:yes stop_codon:yes gene_type:complete
MHRSKVLYIAGYGRSGSSILSRLLGAHADIVSLGEFGRLSVVANATVKCSCGETTEHCEFWRAAAAKGSKGFFREFKTLKALMRERPETWFVDSTKTAYFDGWRPGYYLLTGYDLYVLQLTRSAKSVVESANKGRNRDLERGVPRRRRFEAARTVFGWSFANAVAGLYRLALGRKGVCMAYEDLTADPKEFLSRLGEFMGLDLEEVMVGFGSGQALPPGHEIAGNRALRESSLGLRKDRQQ